MKTVIEMLLLASLMLTSNADRQNHLLTFPQSPVVEVGSNFTATCVIINTTEVVADDLYWNLSETTLPREYYTKINSSALSVTFTVTSEKSEWLYCRCSKKSLKVFFNDGRYIHGIYLLKGYAVQQPVNLSCVAVQIGRYISESIRCYWNYTGRQTADVPTNFIVNVKSATQENHTSTHETTAEVVLGPFPHYFTMEVWVVAENRLGSVESEHLREDASWFVKTNPPSDVWVISEPGFHSSLLLNWTHPINPLYVRLIYQIRYAPEGAHTWTYVPEVDTSRDIQSFRLQNLKPDTLYVAQVSCKNARPGHGYWSDWSNNATERTPEARPEGKPDLWRFISESENTERQVQIVCKEPVRSNGRIIRYDVKIQVHSVTEGIRSLENVSVSTNVPWRSVTVLRQVPVGDHQSVRASVSAVNSVGRSADAFLFISGRERERPPVEDLMAWPQDGRLMVKWRPPTGQERSEVVVEWSGEGQRDWQKERGNISQTYIKGPLQPFVCYQVSVVLLGSGWSSKAVTQEAFLEEGVPLAAPSVSLDGVPGHKEVNLKWNQIPCEKRRGFITNYTIHYRTGADTRVVTIPGSSSSYKLTSLSPDTTYDTWITAHTIAGSHPGSPHSFTTQKYGPGQIEFIVVGASLGFLFIFLMAVLLCFYKRDVIKENLWPQIPDPGESTIGNWSPDYPLKAEPPRESCVSGISVLDIDIGDGRSVFDEEKAGLPLKKDKFLSEEHSSGIGGSSCMSSPRQSVSDSDEGGDMADTTASTVQYSSVVASSGYKGQTPAQAPPTFFSRSESTQPLLDCEENPDTSPHEGSRQLQRCSRPAGELREELQNLEFCPLQEDSESNTPADDQSDAASSYMPQLGGYRPQ
ncbi:interleukin-6 receptor subunit beta isoform X2 [Xyrichtys novacula]|uniref:Interleukin-6 receptor subunit beta isoform X2 n=1 Tax=Xyrichtys novacula TaxID=13765 RepID=A0AAV1GA69_XYRNO|nr:interleukin-6 receptor subunit beta isoform X2 [Xyrichtys novacula]